MLLWFILIQATLIGCTRDLSEPAKVSIQLPAAKSLSAKGASSQSASEEEWGLADPTELTEIGCYVILIVNSAETSSADSCESESGQTVAYYSSYYGGFAAGETITMEVPTDGEKIISLVGLATSSAAACSRMIQSGVDKSQFSQPHYLGNAKIDPQPGFQEVTIEATITDGIETCSSKFFEDETDGPDNLGPAKLVPQTLSYDFGNVGQSLSRDVFVTLENQGGEPATGVDSTSLSAPFGFSGGGYPGTSGTCGTQIAAGETCTVQIAYSPTTVTADSGTLVFNYNDGTSAQSSDPITLDGHGRVAVTTTSLVLTRTQSSIDTNVFAFTDGMGASREVAISATHAYVDSDDHGLVIFDISNSANPYSISSFYSSVIVRHLEVYGSYLFVLSNNELIVLDISDPVVPLEVAVLGSLGSPVDFVINGTTIFVSDNSASKSIHAVDFSDPENITSVGSLVLSSATNMFQIAYGDNHIYAATGWSSANQFSIIDVSTPASMTEVYSGDLSVASLYATGVEFSNGTIFVSNANVSVIAVDVSSPATPSLTSTYSSFLGRSSNSKLIEYGNLLYILNEGNYALSRIDVTNPAAPNLSLTEIAYEDSAGCSPCAGYGFAISSTHTYVAAIGDAAGFYIAPLSPSPTVGSISISGLSGNTSVSAGDTLTVTGTGFDANTEVRVCDALCGSLSVAGPTSLTCSIPALSGSCPVDVRNNADGDKDFLIGTTVDYL